MNKVNFTPQTDVDQYLNNFFNIEIYRELTEDQDWQGIFEPLEYFNLFYDQFEIVKANKNNPTSLVKHLSGLDLDEKKYYFLLNNLSNLIFQTANNIVFDGFYTIIDNEKPIDKQLHFCNTFIKMELAKLNAKLYPKIEKEEEPEEEEENKYDFTKVKRHIETLTNIEDKIKYLIERKTDYLQNKSLYDSDIETPFDKKCDLEIEKLKRFLSLEEGVSIPGIKPQLGKFTNSQLVLIFYYFFKANNLEPRNKIDIAPIAKFIHLVTGKSFKSTVNSDYYKKLKTAPNLKKDKELIKDLEAIKPLFLNVQLSEVITMIDNEITIARKEIKQNR